MKAATDSDLRDHDHQQSPEELEAFQSKTLEQEWVITGMSRSPAQILLPCPPTDRLPQFILM